MNVLILQLSYAFLLTKGFKGFHVKHSSLSKKVNLIELNVSNIIQTCLRIINDILLVCNLRYN